MSHNGRGEMRVRLSREGVKGDFLRQVEEASGQNPYACYQCGQCSAGCPAAFAMELLPNQVIRLVQLGRKEEALNCSTIWLCAGCLTCMARCPKGVDLARIMEALRELAMETHGDDYFDIRELTPAELIEYPQQGSVGGMRKYTR